MIELISEGVGVGGGLFLRVVCALGGAVVEW